ncbi:hypothetical protein OSTOST_11122, partial [Ostertagia ostertagi]
MKQFLKKDHFKSFKRKAVDENENEMGDTIEEINKKSGVADSLYQGDITSYKANETVKAAFRKAAQLWTDDTCIDIEEYDWTKYRTSNFLDVEDGDGCFSQVGRKEEKGPQPLRLGKGCGS